jgi:glyoxylate/hydroxypyruvate reductase A
VEHAVVWNPPAGFFRNMDKLQAVFVLGAGVDRILKRDDLDPAVPVIRLTDAGMAQQMLEYVLYGVLHVQRHMGQYRRQHSGSGNRWWRLALPRRASVCLAWARLVARGAVAGGHGLCGSGLESQWPAIAGVQDLSAKLALPALLARTDILVNLLPSTGYAWSAQWPHAVALAARCRPDQRRAWRTTG